MKANKTQVGGQHYKSSIQHWDYVVANDIPYLEAMTIKYLTRWRKKNGAEDLYKAKHFLRKLFETEELDFEADEYEGEKPGKNYVDPDNNYSTVTPKEKLFGLSSKMVPYPTLDEIEKAPFDDLVRWYALCPTPGISIDGRIGRNAQHIDESIRMGRIAYWLGQYDAKAVSQAVEAVYREQDAIAKASR